MTGDKRSAYRILVGKPDRKRPLGRRRHRWEDNVRMDLRGAGWGGMDWIYLAWDGDQWRAVLKRVIINQPSGSIKYKLYNQWLLKKSLAPWS
jgi:hypothetical protein